MDHLITPDLRSRERDVGPTVADPPPNIPEGYDNGTVVPAAYATTNTAYYIGNPTNTLSIDDELILNGGVLQVVGGVLELDGVPVGGGGGGAVNQVSGTAGQVVVAPTTGNVVVSLANVGTAGATTNVASITTDAQGRITSKTSYGYVPQSAADVENAVNIAVSAYAPLAGATFTGAVNTTGTTLSVAPPVASSNAATKLYVDNAVAGITPGGAVNTVVGGSNISVNSSNAASPIVNLDITSAINMQTNEINNCGNITAPVGAQMDIRAGEINLIQSATGLTAPEVSFPFPTVMNLTAGGAIGITAGGAVGMAAGGVVNMTAVGSASIFATGVGPLAGEIMLGGPINHITIENDGVSLTGVGNITASSNVSADTMIASSSLTAPTHNVGTSSNFNNISLNAANGFLQMNNSVAPVVGEAGILDSHYNPARLTLSNTTLSVNADGGNGSNVVMSSVDLAAAGPAGIRQYATITQAPGGTYAVSAAQANSALWFDLTAGGNLNITLPNGVPDGTMFYIGLPYNTASGSQLTVFPVGGGLGAGRETVIKAANGGCLYIANGTAAGNVMYIPTDTGAYLSLTGGTLTGALTVEPTTNIEAKNITTALLTPLIDVGYISALGPLQVEGGNFLVANPAGSEIGLAASANPAPGEVATITYNYSVDDMVHVNKVIEAPGAILDGNDVVPLLTFKDAATFYVSKQGADTNSGAANEPFLTVQAAINAALATGAEAVVDVAPGTYNENLTIASVAGIIIRGVAQSDRLIEGTILQGVISIQCNTTDNMNNNQVMITGCTVLGHIHDTSTKQHTLIVDSCRIEGDNADGGRAIQVQLTATDGRTFVNNCVITQEAGTTGTNPVVSADVGFLNINQCDITARAEGCCITVSGTALLSRLAISSLTSTSASANPNALLLLSSTSASPHNIALTSFTYGVATSKTTPAILATRPSAGSITAVLASNIFAVAGTLAAGNVIQYSAGTALVLLVANNRSLNSAAAPYASQIQSGTTVLPLSQVGETSVSSVNGLSGALTVAAGSNIAITSGGGVITINGTKNGTLTGVGAGSGIAVDNTNPAVPVVSNSGVLSLIAGSNISLSGSTGNITISASGGGGGPGGVDSVSGGTGINVDNTDPQNVIVNNTGVLTVGVGSGLVNSGTSQNPVIALDSAGTINTSNVQTVRFNASGTGSDVATFDAYPQINGAYTPPTNSNDLVPKQYVDGQSYGVQSITAGDASINVGGTPTDPTIAVAASGVSGGTYTYATLTVGADGRLTAASSGAAPVATVSAGTGIAVDNTIPTAPVISNTGLLSATAGAGISIAGSVGGNLDIANTGVLGLTAADASITVAGTASNPTVALPNQTLTPAAYTWPALTVDQKGVITAIAENDVPFTELNAGTGISISGSPGSATIANTGVLSVAAGNGSITVAGTAADPTVAVAASGVVAGAYTNASLTVGADGRLTAASSGAAPVLSVSGTAGQTTSTGGTTPAIGLATTGVLAGAYTNASLTLDAYGRATAAASGPAPVLSVSGTAAQIASTGGANPVLSLVDTAVAPGSYTNASLTVDSKGRLTAASSGTAPVLSVSGTTGEIASTGGVNPVMSLVDTAVVPGAYTYTSLTVDRHGRLTAAASGPEPVVSVNGNAGAITLSGGSNVVITEPTPGTLVINSTASGGGGIASINSETGPAITIAAGSGISVGTVANTITITNTGGGGGGGVQSITDAPGGGILIDNTDPANPILSNGGVISLQAFQANQGNIEIDNLDGFIGITTIPDPTPGSVQKIRLGYNALNNITAANGSITLGGTTQVRSISANPGGTAYANIDMGANYQIISAAGINTTNKLSFADIGGLGNGYAMKGSSATDEPGITRVEVDSTNADVANTTALMYDERNYAPTSPFSPASGFTPGPGGAFVSGVAKLIASQTTTLTQANWPCKYASKYLGVAGSISFTLSAAQPLSYLVRFRKNGGSLINASGGIYYTSTQSVSVPVNGITWNGVGGTTYTVGDTFTWELYATYTGATPPSIATAPTVFSAVFSPLAV